MSFTGACRSAPQPPVADPAQGEAETARPAPSKPLPVTAFSRRFKPRKRSPPASTKPNPGGPSLAPEKRNRFRFCTGAARESEKTTGPRRASHCQVSHFGSSAAPARTVNRTALLLTRGGALGQVFCAPIASRRARASRCCRRPTPASVRYPTKHHHHFPGPIPVARPPPTPFRATPQPPDGVSCSSAPAAAPPPPGPVQTPFPWVLFHAGLDH